MQVVADAKVRQRATLASPVVKTPVKSTLMVFILYRRQAIKSAIARQVTPDAGYGHGSSTSAPARVARASSNHFGVVRERKCTEPSTMAKFAPEG